MKFDRFAFGFGEFCFGHGCTGSHGFVSGIVSSHITAVICGIFKLDGLAGYGVDNCF